MRRPTDWLLDGMILGLAVAGGVVSALAILNQLGLPLSSWWTWLLLVVVVVAPLAPGLRRWRRREAERLARLDRLAVRGVVRSVDPARDLHVASRVRLRAGSAPYVERLVDAELRRKLRRERFVLVVGRSKAGKSRTAYEAARAVLADRLLVAPRHVRHDTLDMVFQSLRPRDGRRGRVLLWLDELDRYITARALTVQLLDDWRRRWGSVVVLATMGEIAYHRLIHPSPATARSSKQEAGQAAAVLDWADTVFLPDQLEGPEIERATRLYPGHDWSRLSLGATLALGPQLVDRYRTAAEAVPGGVACVSAVIDWRRAGLTRPIRASELREIHRDYMEALAPRRGARPGDLEFGLRWALEPLPGSDVSLLYPRQLDDGESAYEPDDYVLAYRDERGEPAGRAEPMPERMLARIVGLPTVAPDEALQVGFTTMLRGSLGPALEVYELVGSRCSGQAEREVAAWARCGSADVLGRLDRRPEAIAACDEVVTRFGGSDEPALQRAVAWALVHKGVSLGELGREGDEMAAYDEVSARFGGMTDTALREQVAVALCNKGVALALLGELEHAIEPYDEVIGGYGEGEQPVLREQVVLALYQKGLALEQMGRPGEALAVYDAVLAHLHDSSPPARLAPALFRRAVTLGQLGRGGEAIAAYGKLIGRFSAAADPGVRELVAWAMYNRAVRLGAVGRTEDEIAGYDEVVRRCGGDGEPEVLEVVANALINKGGALARLRRRSRAIGAYQEVERRFGSSADPLLREAAALALYNRAVALGHAGRHEAAAAAYAEVARRSGVDAGSRLRDVAAMAHLNSEIARRYLRHRTAGRDHP